MFGKLWLQAALLGLLTPVLLAAAPLTPVSGRVIKAPLNVRAGAGAGYTVVGQLAMNNPVAITAANREWLEIRPPENTAVWVLEKFVRNNRFTVNVNLRSGPGIGYESLGTGRAGMPATTVGQATPSGWIMIQPYYWMRVYVGRGAIAADDAELARLPKLPAERRPLPQKELTKLEGNFTQPGKEVRITGYLYAVEAGKSVATHVLYRENGAQLQPEVFVVPCGVDLSKLNEKKVQLSGTQYPVANWELPVIIVSRAQAAQ